MANVSGRGARARSHAATSPRAATLLALSALSLLAACGLAEDDPGNPTVDTGAPADDAATPDDEADASNDIAAPAADAATDDAGTPTDDAGVDADPSFYSCRDVPTAYVFDHADPWTGVQGAADLLARAGFDVQALPLDRDPTQLRGLIFFASFASESAAYRAYVTANATTLYNFVDRGNVLLQMTQADQTEAIAPFLPAAYQSRRSDLDLARLKVLDPGSPLLAGIDVTSDGYLAWAGGNIGWETFVSQRGFQTIMAEDGTGANGALMEAPYGQGRFILTAMAFDKPLGTAPVAVPFPSPIGTAAQRDAFNQAFFANLYQHVKEVCRRRAKPVNVTPPSGRPTFANDSFMLAVLPDTQFYSLLYPGIYNAQTSWIAINAATRHIPYVLHLGDIVNNNSVAEWQHAYAAMSLLDGVVPYALATGNHDYGPDGNASTRDTLLNDYFPFAKQAAMPSFGGAHQDGKLDNTYHLFSAGGRDYIVISLEWGPRDALVAWANDVMDHHPDRYGILITHAYMNNDDRRYDYTDTANPQDYDPHFYGTAGGNVNDGEELWQKLVRKHRFVLTLNGHVLGDGTGYLASVNDLGFTTHQILSNYQFRNLGGEGYMRLMEFLADGRTVRVYTYSPLYDSFLVEADQSFTIALDLPPPRMPPPPPPPGH